MALKKSELYSSIWKSCDALRGGMDASQYKDYVLVLLFIKYVSDKYAGQKNPLIVVPQGGGFADMVALKGKKDIGEKMNVIISSLAEANGLKGVIDRTDFDDETKLGKGKEMQDRLSDLVAIFENPALDFTRNRAEGDDLLGDAYEYLMRHFATDSGKSKGQFYTPAEVSRVIAKVIGISKASSPTTTLYDPTCGSGSLLLKAADEAKTDISIYGQEKDIATTALAKMNMILHGFPSAVLAPGGSSTLANPHFLNDQTLKTFDYVVSNPPFSDKAWGSGFKPSEDLYGRFEDGVPPQKNGDFAFLSHVLRSLNSKGKGAIILPHGVLFRGNSEGEIRKKIVRRGYIEGIIGLPANLFYGTGIPACILVLDKENAVGRKGIFMVNASQGFIKDGNKNRLRHQDIHKIVDVFTRKLETPKYARMAPLAEIEANGYNLNIPRYIDNSVEEDFQDIEAHLLGGIPNRDLEALSDYWQVFPGLRAELFTQAERAGYSSIKVETAQIKPRIFSHAEFLAFHAEVTGLLEAWKHKARQQLTHLGRDSHPKALVDALAEDLLAAFMGETRRVATTLVDKYDLYQRLMDYWTETMQDDVYLVTEEGWLTAGQLRRVVEVEGQKSQEKADLVLGKVKLKADLIPPALIVARYFAKDQHDLESLQADLDALSAQLDDLKEEHGGENGLLLEVIEKDKISKANVEKRLGEIGGSPEFEEERSVLAHYLNLLEREAKTKKCVKDTRQALDEKTAVRYENLSDADVQTLVVDDKWLAALSASLKAELDHVSQSLTRRIKELAERYEMPLPQQSKTVEELTGRVDANLKKMGFVWN